MQLKGVLQLVALTTVQSARRAQHIFTAVVTDACAGVAGDTPQIQQRVPYRVVCESAVGHAELVGHPVKAHDEVAKGLTGMVHRSVDPVIHCTKRPAAAGDANYGWGAKPSVSGNAVATIDAITVSSHSDTHMRTHAQPTRTIFEAGEEARIHLFHCLVLYERLRQRVVNVRAGEGAIQTGTAKASGHCIL